MEGGRSNLCGGWNEGDASKPEVTEMANFAVPHLQSGFEHPKFFTLKSIDKMEQQVVSGMNYKMMLTLVETTTDKKDAEGKKLEEHTVADKPHTVTCKVVVYDQPWTGRREVSSMECGTPVA